MSEVPQITDNGGWLFPADFSNGATVFDLYFAHAVAGVLAAEWSLKHEGVVDQAAKIAQLMVTKKRELGL